MVEKSYGDREARELWANLQVHLFFDLIGNIKHPILSVIWQCIVRLVSTVYSWRSLSFSQMWRLSLLSSMAIYGEVMWQSVQTAQSSLTLPPSTAIQSLSWVSLRCLVALTALSTLLTMKRFLKHQNFQRETNFINSFITWITGTTLVVATEALQLELWRTYWNKCSATFRKLYALKNKQSLNYILVIWPKLCD